MKKVVMLLFVILSACFLESDEVIEQSPYEPEDAEIIELNYEYYTELCFWEEFSQIYSVFENYFAIRVADEEFLNEFEYIHRIGSYVPGGQDVVIWAVNEALTGIEFSEVVDGNDGTFDDFFYVQGEIVLTLDNLPPGHAILLHNHVGRSWHPAWAVSFLDSNEQRRYVGFLADLTSEIAPLMFAEFALDEGRPPFALPPWNTATTMTTTPHPFAIALKEYMAGYAGVVRAYLVTLDDYGTMGVLTTRPTTRKLSCYDNNEYRYGPSGTLFYIQDGDLFQIDVSGWLFAAGRYNRLMERLYGHTHIVELIYKLQSGRLEVSTRLEYFSDEYLAYLFDDYDVVAKFIAERDVLAEYAREKYGLVALLPHNFGHMQNMEDQTAQVLAMTINCVPKLIHD